MWLFNLITFSPHYPLLSPPLPVQSSFYSTPFAPLLILGEPMSLIRVLKKKKTGKQEYRTIYRGKDNSPVPDPRKKNTSSSLSNPQLPIDPQEEAGLWVPPLQQLLTANQMSLTEGGIALLPFMNVEGLNLGHKRVPQPCHG